MKVIAHRGASSIKPENTLSAIEEALALNVEAIELDVHLLRDNGNEYLIVIHDRYVDGTTNGTGRVTDHSFEQLRGLDAGNGEPIPTLWEALKIINGRCDVNIELKTEGTTKLVHEKIQRAINELDFIEDQFLISSFDHPLLVNSKKLNPNIKIGALISHIGVDYAAIGSQLGAYSINPSVNCINKRLVEDAHERGLKVYVYTVDEKEDIKMMIDFGVDGIFSNHPENARRLIEKIT